MAGTDVAAVALGVAAIAGLGSAQEYVDAGIQKIADAYLDKTNASTWQGRFAAIAATLAISVVEHTLNPLFMQTDATFMNDIKAVTARFSSAKASDWTRRAFALFLQPSINGIVVVSTSETSNREVDTNEEPLIVQTAMMSTEYVVDNAVPKPRTWTVTGYLISLLPAADQLLSNKPTIWFQKKMLDAFTKSRRPVLYKASDLEFTQCLITSFNWEYEANVNNALKVTIGLKEFITMTVENDIAMGTKKAIKKGAAE